MRPFEYVLVLVSIVIGLGPTRAIQLPTAAVAFAVRIAFLFAELDILGSS